ncbi:MAG: sugar transferase [Rhodocyclaceae bacterium]|nr:sugar transferase [Rhodocyclaceae bacterium]
MTRPISKSITFIVFVATLIGLVMGVKTLLISKQYFPYLDVAGPEGIRIQVLQQGQPDSAQCVRTLASQVTALRGNCPSCRIETSNCKSELDVEMRKWLGEEPVSRPSVRMAYGVIIFDAPHLDIALGACQESEKRSDSNIPIARIKCFPVGTKRELLDIELIVLQQQKAAREKLIGVFLLTIFALIVLSVASKFFTRRFVARAPLEGTTTLDSAGKLVAFKLSNVLKRVADILIATSLLAILLPIFVLVAVAIRVLEGSPIFYVSRRFIAVEKSVNIYKFRTMVRDAISPKYQLKERFMRDGYLDIPLSCEVYTSIGRLLERSQLVETLQCINILFDGMSFVGNRPLPEDNIVLLKKFQGWQERFDSPAGITGISQIVGKHGLLPQQRLYLERLYSSVYRNPNGNIFICDAYIVAKTAHLLLSGGYLDYERAVAFLIRCGADKNLPY